MDSPAAEPAAAVEAGLGQRVASLCGRMCKEASVRRRAPLAGGEPQAQVRPLAELVDITSSQDFNASIAVSMVVSHGLQFIPKLCREISSRSGASSATLRGALPATDRTVLAQSVYVLCRIVVKLVDKERELQKVGKLIYKNDVLPHLTALIDGEASEMELPGSAAEGDIRRWVMTIVRWCFHYDKMKQLGKEAELYEAHDQLFSLGFYLKVVHIFGTGPMNPTTVAAAGLLQGLADCPKTRFRAKLRKTGVILLASARLKSEPTFRMCSIFLYNMSRSLVAHNSLREADLLAIAQQLVPERSPELAGPETDPIIQLSITLAVANVYGTVEDDREEAAAFLSRQHVSLQIVQMMENTLDGLDGIPEVTDWDVSGEEVAFMACCLSQHGSFNQKMVDAGLLDVLRKVLEQRDDSELPCVRTLMNLSYTPEVHESIKAANLIPLLEDLSRSPDMRVSDAAKGCLFQLGYDVKQKSFKTRPGRLMDDQPDRFNVFLSHRRSDAKDFARALFNLLTQRGYSTYLDFEYLRELNDLRDCVRRSDNFIFVLSDTVFDSYWCKEELMTAVENNCNVILVVKEGSKWRNLDGQDVYDFPPEHLIKALPPAAQALFNNNVAIKHSDEYYQSFVGKVLDRLVRTISGTRGTGPGTPTGPPDGGGNTAVNARHGPASTAGQSGPRAEVPLAQVSSEEVVGKLKAVVSAASQEAKTSIINANSTEVQQLKHELSREVASQQRQFSSELAHLRREVAAEIAEVRREVATDMSMMKASLSDMSLCLRDLTAAFRQLAQQQRPSPCPGPGALPLPLEAGGAVGVQERRSPHMQTAGAVPVMAQVANTVADALTSPVAFAGDHSTAAAAGNVWQRSNREVTAYSGVHQRGQEATASPPIQYIGGTYTRAVGGELSSSTQSSTHRPGQPHQAGAKGAAPAAPGPTRHTSATRHHQDNHGSAPSSGVHLPPVRQSVRNR